MKELGLYAMAAMALMFASCEKEETTETRLITFEDVNLGENGYWDGSDLSGTSKVEESYGSQVTNYYGSFADNGFVFENVYTPDWYSWKGFACSSLTDTETAGYANQ